MVKTKSFWITVSLFNLCIVALLGLVLRSKILFSIPFLDFRNVESAHSHFAFAGWAGLALITLLIHQLLPPQVAQKKFFTGVLIAIQISSLGMAVVFPFYGYNPVSLFFSTLFIVTTVVFVPVYIRHLLRNNKAVVIRILGISACTSLVLSYLGTLGLVYILSSRSSNSFLYRDSIYTFLHFQYNGFFTLSVCCLLYDQLVKRGMIPGKNFQIFSVLLCAAIIPSLFLSMLWHNSVLYYILASAGSVLLFAAIIFFLRSFAEIRRFPFTVKPLVKIFFIFSALSFILKSALSAGTIIPSLGDAIYGDRPVIIGFLHLVFLGFLSFYLLASFIEDGIFTYKGRILKGAMILFAAGIFLNELFLFSQGLFILFSYNSEIFKWLLWGAAIILFSGAIYMYTSRLRVMGQKKGTE